MRLVAEISDNIVFELVLIAVVMDTLFGAGRGIRYRKFNSSVGIDGAIRKISMLLSLVFLFIIDRITHLNLIGFIPDEIRAYFPNSMNTIGLLEFFGLLYLCYETVSILKNMTLCGLPVNMIWEKVRDFLEKYTEELPDTDELGEPVKDESQEMEAVKEQ